MRVVPEELVKWPPTLLFPVEELPPMRTEEEYKRMRINNMRAMWSQMIEHCREVGEPEPDPAVLAEWEAAIIDSIAADYEYKGRNSSRGQGVG
jgi:hypothetical protein